MQTTKERLEKRRKNFTWLTAEGEHLSLSKMRTGHIFNSMKMIYNHLAHTYKIPTVWFKQKYCDYFDYAETEPKNLAEQVAIFILEIESRNNLPIKYQEPYMKIIYFLSKVSGKGSQKILTEIYKKYRRRIFYVPKKSKKVGNSEED